MEGDADFLERELTPGRFIHSSELGYVNRHWAFLDNETENASPLRSVWRRTKRIIRTYIFGDYIQNQNQFNQQLVHYLNQLTKEIDGRFWRTIHDEHTASFHALERRFSADLGKAVHELETCISKLAVSRSQSDAKIESLEAVTKGLERVVLSMGHTLKSLHDAFVMPLSNASSNNINHDTHRAQTTCIVPSYEYLLFENRFRGSEAEITKRLSVYPPLFANAKLPVIEIGAGRGELQGLFKKAGTPCYGLELDSALAEQARLDGFDVRLENGLTHLSSLPDRSVGGVIAIQVVEHLQREELCNFIKLCAAKVVVGGVVVFETINPESLVALSQNFYKDISHIAPLHSEALKFAMEVAGLEIKEVKPLSKYPEEVALREITKEDYMTPKWAETIDVINHNIRILNTLLFGHQDYCIVASIPLV